MGEYFEAVCHTCKKTFRPPSYKLREIQLSIAAAAAVGHFFCLHPGHRLELRGDEYNYDAGENIDGYERVPDVGDSDAIDAVREYEAMRQRARLAESLYTALWQLTGATKDGGVQTRHVTNADRAIGEYKAKVVTP